MEAHGGVVGVRSKGLGHGSTFFFEVPARWMESPSDEAAVGSHDHDTASSASAVLGDLFASAIPCQESSEEVFEHLSLSTEVETDVALLPLPPPPAPLLSSESSSTNTSLSFGALTATAAKSVNGISSSGSGESNSSNGSISNGDLVSPSTRAAIRAGIAYQSQRSVPPEGLANSGSLDEVDTAAFGVDLEKLGVNRSSIDVLDLASVSVSSK